MDWFTLEKKQKVVESLEKRQADTASINKRITDKNKELQGKWEKESYKDHKKTFQTEYYPFWKENETYNYKEKLKAIDAIKVEDKLMGTFDKQLQPKEHSYWKNRSHEKNTIESYKKEYEWNEVHFDKNTVREMKSLDSYRTYHTDYFSSREHQRALYEEYTKDTGESSFSEKWTNNMNVQREKYGKFFGTATGALSAIKETVINDLFGKKKNIISKKTELDEGLRSFFCMTKKTLFWKKQIGLLGTETKAERKDGSEYNKRLLNTYTKGSAADKVALLDELADKLLTFRLTPNMFTNQYMAKNMLQMQRYTDMLNGFVTMTQCNPDYLDTTNDAVAHTSPEMAALINSRIILMAPIMNRFMTEHAKYFGYKKSKGVLGKNRIDGRPSDYSKEEDYNEFVKETWEMVKEAYNSTADFMDDLAETKMRDGLMETERKAAKERQERKLQNKNTELDDSEFEIRYDLTGTHAKRLLGIRGKISSNPFIYEIYGGDLEQLFNKINEMIRRLDEVETRSSELKKVGKNAEETTFKNVEKFGEMWKTYVEKETARYDAEWEILLNQLDHYEKAVDYLTGQKLDQKDLKLTDPPEEVRNVFEYEGLNHVLAIKDAYEYNDMFYKLSDYYDFDQFKEYTDKDGNKVPIEDLWTRYHFTLLKRGMERARLVNTMENGKTTVKITDVSKLNNIEKRALCMDKFNEAAKKNYRYTLKEIATMDITELTGRYNITTEMDITKDSTYEDYFMAKSIADIGESLEKDPSGKSIKGFEALSEADKDEVRIRGELFRDYFKRWEGQMTYTRSEPYAFIGKIANMQGNNEILEGIGKQYRKIAMSDMKAKADERLNTETDEEKKRKLGELSTFLTGMVIENDYDAKSIKIFGKDAYDAYRAKYYERKVRKEAETVCANDFDELVKDGILKGGEEEKKKYLKRADTAIAIRSEFEKYFAEKAKKDKEKEKEKEKQPSTDPQLAKKEKADMLSAQYRRFLNTVKTFNDAACEEGYLTQNLSHVLSNIDDCLDFLLSLNKNMDDYQLLADTEKFTEKSLADMDRYKDIVITFSKYVGCLIRDYGVDGVNGRVRFVSRKECKRMQIRTDRKYEAELAETDRKLKEHLAMGKAKQQEDKALKAEIEKIKKLYDEENKKNEALGIKGTIEHVSYEKEVDGKKVIQKRLVIHSANKYEKEYDSLLSQRRSFEEIAADINDLHRYLYDDYDKKIEKEETAEKGIRVDYLTKHKKELREELITLNEHKPQEKSRNFVEELFAYIQKNAQDADLMDPEAVTNVLTKAKNARRTALSEGAKREAMLRLEEYSRDRDAMSDYFIWKNTQETNEVLAERMAVFGQDKFVKKNINNIRTIMDAIAEANASVNDIQTPEFLDRLTEDLDLKGIDERQFMFLLRRHNVGFSGLANTLKDADQAMLNKQDVNRYLNASTRNDFLWEAAKDALAAGKKLELANFDEAYILANFADCYFTANKMIAFQQLYYSEQDAFKSLDWFGGEYELLGTEIRRYFDKGHGEIYALYYNAVMAVANKYGVTANGALSFGLPVTEVERLHQQGKSDPETTKTVSKNLAEAQKRSDESFAAINAAYKQNQMFHQIENALDHSMAGVEMRKERRNMKGIDRSDEKKVAKLMDFRKEHTRAYEGAIKFNEGFQKYERENVVYTKRNMDFNQGMFFMGEDHAFANAKEQIGNIDVATNFANLFERDETNIAKNLSVVDENKCKRVMDRIHNMGLDNGKIEKDTKTKQKITDESYLEKNFNTEFYEDMVNAANYCMMFEMNDDFLNLGGYEKQIEKAVTDKKTVIDIYEDYKKKIKASSDAWSLNWNAILAVQEVIGGLEEKLEDSIKKQDKEMEEELKAQISEYQKQFNKYNAELSQCESERKVYQATLDGIYRGAGFAEADHVAEEKLETLKRLRTLFSDKKNRFIISTYVNFFQSWLLKNGIKVDGSFTNQHIFDNSIEANAAYQEKGGKLSSIADSLDVGTKASEEYKKAAADIFAKNLNNITSGQYKKDFAVLEKKDKK